MTTKAPTPDLFQHWKDLYDQLEKTWTRPMHEMLSTETFAASMGATRDNYLTSQKTLREGMEQYLKSLHVPSKTDFTNLAGLVVSLESKVEAVDDRFETLEERLSALDGRYERLEAKLDALNAAINKLVAAPAAPVVEVVVPPVDKAPEAAAKRRATK